METGALHRTYALRSELVSFLHAHYDFEIQKSVPTNARAALIHQTLLLSDANLNPEPILLSQLLTRTLQLLHKLHSSDDSSSPRTSFSTVPTDAALIVHMRSLEAGHSS